MSGTSQLSIPYGDRPLGRTSGGGVFATPEFLQFLERLQDAIRSVPSSASAAQNQINQNTTSINTLNSDVTALRATDTNLQSQLTSLQTRRPSQVIMTSATAVALTSGAPATVFSWVIPTGAWLVLSWIYLHGTGTVTWGRGSLGYTAAAIDPTAGQHSNIVVGSASPTTLGFDLSIPLVGMTHTSDLAVATVYVCAAASFTGSISAYAALIADPL